MKGSRPGILRSTGSGVIMKDGRLRSKTVLNPKCTKAIFNKSGTNLTDRDKSTFSHYTEKPIPRYLHDETQGDFKQRMGKEGKNCRIAANMYESVLYCIWKMNIVAPWRAHWALTRTNLLPRYCGRFTSYPKFNYSSQNHRLTKCGQMQNNSKIQGRWSHPVFIRRNQKNLLSNESRKIAGVVSTYSLKIKIRRAPAWPPLQWPESVFRRQNLVKKWSVL